MMMILYDISQLTLLLLLLLHYATQQEVAPVGVFTSGKGSSAAGLTASVIRDPATREFYLEVRSLVLVLLATL